MKNFNTWERKLISILIILFCLLFIASLEAATLSGTVKGKNKQPKKYVRIEIGGPQNKTIFSDKKGNFSINLKGGKYTIRITEKNKSLEYNFRVPGGNTTLKKQFDLNW